MNARVVVTGMGCVTSLGAGVEPMWDALVKAESFIRPLQRFDTSDYRSKIAAEIDDNVLAAQIDLNLNRLSRNAKFAVAAAHEALTKSGLLEHAHYLANTGICLGSGLGGLYYTEEALTSLLGVGTRGLNPMLVPIVDPNSIVNQVAMRWGIAGQQLTVSTACSSSAHALGMSLDMIRSGRCSSVLTGGVEATVSPLIFAGFDRLRAMSRRNDEPDIACRPFSTDRDGFVMAEGGAMLLLESEEQAHSRNATIYAEVLGYGSSGGAFHTVMPLADGSDSAKAMMLAISDAGITPSEVDLINPHATGTVLNDRAEYKALKKVFGTRLGSIPLTPTKQLTGHMLGGAGALESLHVIKSISESCVTPIRHWDNSCDLNISTESVAKQSIKTAISNSFGFGNNNVSLIFGEYK